LIYKICESYRGSSLRNFDRLIARELLNLSQQYFCRPFIRMNTFPMIVV